MDRSLLSRATDSSEAPTPGYLYVDLAKQAASNPSVCQDMARYLTNRLSTKQSPYIKAKCCKVLAKLCEQVPRNAFRRVLAQDAQAVSCIKQALAFRGPLDPLQGDAKNEAVRVAARQALDAVYAEAPAVETSAGGAAMGGMSGSYGASPHSTMNGAGGPHSRRMEGIGNPMFADPRLAHEQQQQHGGAVPPNLQAAVKEASEVVMGMIRDPLARNIGATHHHHHHHAANVPSQGHSGDLPGYNRSATYGRPPPGASELSRQTNGQWTMASNRGPGAYNNNSYYQNRTPAPAVGGTSVSSGGVGGSWGNASAGGTTSTPSIASQAREPAYGTPSITITPGRHTPAASGATSDGSYEKNLIMELCPPGGLKPVPPAEKLADFVKAAPSLNADWICPVLLDCLEDGQPWIIRAKALHVMEAAVAHGGNPTTGVNPYRDFFYACAEEVVPLGSHPRTAIAEPAKRVLALLGVQGSGGGRNAAAARSSSAPPVAAPPPASDLLDFGEAPAAAPPASAPPPPPPAASPAPASSSLFGGMQVKGKSATTAAAAAAVSPALAAPAADLFDFGAPAAAAPVADPFASAASQAVKSTESSPPSSMFAQMQVKDKATTSVADAAASTNSEPAVATSGSAFGFINEEKKTAAPAAAASAPPPSFDPLLYSSGASNNTATKSPGTGGMPNMKMQLSPEQLQAIAYQQMMMQQQMQQMQMAMMRGAAPPRPPVYRQTSGSGGVQQMTPQAFNMMPKQAKKDDKKFDFVKDAMISEKKH